MLPKNQLIDLVQHDQHISQLYNLSCMELTEKLGDGFAAMKDFDQMNPHHDRDLLAHTLAVVRHIRCDGLELDEFTVLRLAALFHDIGKPDVAFMKGDRQVFYGHAERSAEIAKQLLIVCGFDSEMIGWICFFIRYHDAFISFRLPQDMPRNPNPYIKEINNENVLALIADIQRQSKESNDYCPSLYDFVLLMELCAADASGQAEQVYQNGKMIASRLSKLQQVEAIRTILLTEEN